MPARLASVPEVCQVQSVPFEELNTAPRLPTATYAEFHSTGPGANPAARESYAKQLTAAEAKKYETKVYLAGPDGWDPTLVR